MLVSHSRVDAFERALVYCALLVAVVLLHPMPDESLLQADSMADMPKEKEDAVRTRRTTFEVLDLLGKGSFGAVYRVKRVSDGKELAMKCESVHIRKQILRHEAKVLQATAKIPSPHLLQFEDKGRVNNRFLYIVIRLVGKNLWNLRMELPEKKFSVGTSLKTAEQCLAGIRDLHRAGYLHRDIKPPNFAIGREEDGNQHTVYILDFGLCRRFRTDSKDLRLPREKAAFRGTTRYASLNTLEMKEQSRKDDLESWWYMVVEFMIGNLPWKHCRGSERVEVRVYKQQLREQENMGRMLKNTPSQWMRDILLYLDTLEYNDIPDYDFCYKQIAAASHNWMISYEEALDWDLMTAYRGPKYELGIDPNPKGDGE